MVDTQRSVKLRIMADAGTAKETLDDIASKTDQLDGKKSSINVRVNSGTTKEDLDEITVKADALGIERVTFTVKADTKPARAELDLLKLKTDTLNSDVSGSGGLLGSFGKLFNLGGGAGGEAGSAGESAGGLGGSTLVGLGLMLPVIGALAVEVTGLVTGFAAAGAGAGAFALLAMPAFKTVLGALKDTKSQLAGLSPDERGAVEGIKGLETEFKKLSLAFEPMAFKVFNDGLKVASDLLPFITPMANAFAGALDGLLKRLDKFTQSQGFADFMKKFTADIGPAVTAIGNGLGKILPIFGRLLTLMSKKDVVQSIGIAFDIVAIALTGLVNGISRFMKNYDSFTATIRRDSHDISSSFDSIRHGVAVAFNWVINFVKGIPGNIKTALSAIPGLLFNIGENAMIGLLNGFISWYDRIINWVENNLFGGIIGKALHLLGINSPSKVFADMGAGIVKGLVLGMDRNVHKAVGSVGNLAKSVSAGFNPTLNAGSVAGARAGAGRGNYAPVFNVQVSGVVGDAAATGREIIKAANEYLRQTGQPALAGA